ncbi:MAG TPA: ice-binding family protein [Candidatus Dormibacteraeota bacterium]
MPSLALAATQPNLGTADNFAVLAGSTVTNTGPTVITGDLGVSPGTAVTGFPPGIVNGAQHKADAVALKAKTDLVTGYNDAAGQTPFVDKTGQDLGGQNLTPGVYRFSSSAQLTGKLTLNGQGNSNAVFIFQIGSTLTTASNSSVVLMNGASPCSIWWQIGSSATLGTGTQFQGNLLALTSISLTTGANILPGRALARNGAVTLDTNRITKPANCVATSPVASPSAHPKPPVTGSGPPQPGGFPWELMLIVGLSSLGVIALGLRLRARRRRPEQAGR